MESRVLLLFTPKVLITLLLLIAISFMLSNTKIGRALFLMGGTVRQPGLPGTMWKDFR